MTNGDRQAAQASVRAEDGAAALEFAIVFVLLMMLLFGIIRFGQFFGQYEAMVGAAREGGRVAAVQGNTTAIQNQVINSANPYIVKCAAGTGATCITISPAPGGATNTPCNNTNSGANVTVSWNQIFSLSWAPFFPATAKTVTIKAVFRCE